MKRTVSILIASIMMFLLFAPTVKAQDGKIKIEISKNIDGEEKTFKGEYNSVEEMKADPNYQEFAGDDDVNVWFGGDDDRIRLHLDHLRNGSNSIFKFFDGDEEDGNSFFFHHFNGDSLNEFFSFNFDDWDSEEGSENFKEELREMMKKLQAHDKEASNRFSIIISKKVSVSDVGDEFGKKGKVDENDQLALQDLSFYPNPSSDGKFSVRFTTPMESEMTIKVFDLQGREVFGRYFGSFSGLYSERIDLSGQEEGIYLLEIAQGGKRLTKKIVIN